MPLYEYQCDSCETRRDEVRRIIDRNMPKTCGCGGVFEHKIFTAPVGRVQEEAHYICPATGEKVTSWAQRKNLFAKHNLVEADEDQEAENNAKRLKKKAKRDELAKNYLPEDLHRKLKDIGKQEGFQV
jgi:putative FmdB family regulatory protein